MTSGFTTKKTLDRTLRQLEQHVVRLRRRNRLKQKKKFAFSLKTYGILLELFGFEPMNVDTKSDATFATRKSGS